ncbi:homoserine O-succinyltransferase [Megasphaera vaginalis (ex Bordigoni et al. 2020)]|uniref:homoserine O-succinyltransferase n=1 Tax=Megasphaera vaginalis (ex Bordigoni et al. 2020) TaxID=2045301 RepID=UPI000C79EC5A|nr:homoserine O-succinyltransferase [Megasphaera vaginalis (ex Bordigoni et al. 2020)]
MPITIKDGLSAREKLHHEGIGTICRRRAVHQDIRPLRILVLNLMPLKEVTEFQLLRLLGDSPLQVEVDFCYTATHAASHVDNTYLEENYLVFADIKNDYYDGFIITGAPVETLDFTAVDYWPEMTRYLDWAKTHVFSTLSFCWGAQSALYHYYHIDKQRLPEKLFGIYEYELTAENHPLLRGFDDRYFIPQSRHTAIDDTAVYNRPELEVLSRNSKNGINIIGTKNYRRFFVLGHFEYDRRTLESEYIRDKQKGLPIAIPENYYPNDNTEETPSFIWCSYAHLFYHNWLNLVYQETPYIVTDMKAI